MRRATLLAASAEPRKGVMKSAPVKAMCRANHVFFEGYAPWRLVQR